jgi:hypothetical protein
MSTNNYPEIAAEYLKKEGWKIDMKQIRPGVYILLCESKSNNVQDQLLTIVVDEPVESVTEDHIEYLIKTAEKMDVSKQAIITAVHFSESVEQLIRRYNIKYISTDEIESFTESNLNSKNQENPKFFKDSDTDNTQNNLKSEIDNNYFNIAKSLFSGWAIVIILSVFDVYLNPTVLLGLLSGGIVFMFQDLRNLPFKLRGYSKWVWIIPTLFIPFLTVPLYWYSRYKIQTN